MLKPLIVLMSIGVALVAPVQAGDSAPHGGDPAVVLEWNQLLEDLLPGSAGPTLPRYYAMMHIAMFDAANSVEGGYAPYRVRVRAPYGASAEAAAAQAAHDVLSALLPAGQGTFDTALAARLATLHPHAAKRGSQVGRAVASQIVAWRQNDGWSTPASYAPPALPGLWQPTPPAHAAAAFAQAGDVEPFALLTSTQYLPRRPPTLSSAEYAAALNEIKQIGSALSSSRTADETRLARQWASVGYRTLWSAVWNNAAEEISQARQLSLLDTARVFAMLNVAMHDGVQTAQASKFVYGLWRPVTAIQRADEDLNAATVADPSWMPLLTTPPYPSYAGNMACIGASSARALALVFETDEVEFTARWTGLPGTVDVAMNYTSLWQMALDQARSRELGGIHFPFDSSASREVCVQVADYVFGNFMVPKRH